MSAKASVLLTLTATMSCVLIARAQSGGQRTEPGRVQLNPSSRTEVRYATPRLVAHSNQTANPQPGTATSAGDPHAPLDISTQFSNGDGKLFPVWTYDIRTSRDGLHDFGSIIG